MEIREDFFFFVVIFYCFHAKARVDPIPGLNGH